MTYRNPRLFTMMMAIVLASSMSANAAIVTTPTGLSAGDSYRLVFTTSESFTPSSSDIEVYNTFVTGLAEAIAELDALNTTWKVIGSTADVDARDNTGTNPNDSTGVAIYNLAGEIVADDNSDLWDSAIYNAIDVTETGGVAGFYVWTGSNASGIEGNGATLGLSYIVLGYSVSTDNNIWISAETTTSSGRNYKLYAMSGVLTVASTVPTPAALPAGLALLGLAAVRRRRR